jgi:hypothetical protein
MSASRRPVGIKLGDGLGDFMKFTTDDARHDDPTGGAVDRGDGDRERAAGALGATGVRQSTRYYGARSTGIH